MNKIITRKNCLYKKKSLFNANEFILTKFFSNDSGKKKEEDDIEIDEKFKMQKGVLSDKQQSVQEESFFHKESQEQLKALKKKVQKEGEKDNTNKK